MIFIVCQHGEIRGIIVQLVYMSIDRGLIHWGHITVVTKVRFLIKRTKHKTKMFTFLKSIARIQWLLYLNLDNRFILNYTQATVNLSYKIIS